MNNELNQTSNDESEPPIQVPFASLSPDAQMGVVDDFIWREGTDYGQQEISHESKQAQICAQIQKGDVLLVFDPGLQSVTLMTKREWKKRAPLE